eukprot:6614206-Lingulodinium_polyedra.AAC.1
MQLNSTHTLNKRDIIFRNPAVVVPVARMMPKAEGCHLEASPTVSSGSVGSAKPDHTLTDMAP